jgi:hypothetical protein
VSGRIPPIDPSAAGALLALLDAARVHAPGCETAWLRGFATARAGERVAPTAAERVATATPEEIAAINRERMGMHGLRTALRGERLSDELEDRAAAIGRVDIVRREVPRDE